MKRASLRDPKSVAQAVLALLAIAAFALSCESPRRVRIVLVTLDTLRFDAFMGGDDERSGMPRLRERAERGTVFLHFHAATPLTQPSHASMFTGLHPWQHGVTRNGQVLAPSFETLAESLRGAGFSTGAVVASFPVAGRFGFRQGFEGYQEDFTEGFLDLRSWEGQTLPSELFYSKAEVVTEQALAALDAATGDKQFFWFHYFDPHAPYGSTIGMNVSRVSIHAALQRNPERKDELLEQARGLYLEDVERLDRSLDRVLERLASESDEYETHILIVSDHGESLGEGDAIGHGFRLAEEELRVPAILISPEVEPGLREDTVGSVDVAPTLLALAGLSSPEHRGRDIREASNEPVPAVGMRRTFAVSPAYELRLDGTNHLLPDLQFYLVGGAGPYVVGNAEGIESPSTESDERFRALFEQFEQSLSGQAVKPIDPSVSRALEALGYVP